MKELIIMDGGSTDSTVEILRQNDDKIKYWESAPDKGIYHAWNKALSHANGDWVCFFGADDLFWDSNVLSKVAPHLDRAYPAVRVVYGKLGLINARGELIYRIGISWDKFREKFRQGACIPHPATMYHKSLFEDHGYFDESFSIAGDYEFLLRELKYSDAFFLTGITMAAMQQGGVSSKPAQTILSLREVRRAMAINGYEAPGVRWLFAYAKVGLRMCLWRIMGDRLTRHVLDLGRQLVGQPRYWTKL